MTQFRTDILGSSGDAKLVRAQQTEVTDDDRRRWDTEGDRFWRIDAWTDAELGDEKRFAHYLANQHVRKRGA